MAKQKQRRRKGQSVQDLLGIRTFTEYGLLTDHGELLFFQISPVNISVLSPITIENKIQHLKLFLTAIPNIEICCTDSSECFDDNKSYLRVRQDQEDNPKVRKLLQQDVEFLDNIQLEMATARQFVIIVRCKGLKPGQVFQEMNKVEKAIVGQGFEVRRMEKPDIKRYLALYLDASVYAEHMPDVDGLQYLT